MRNTGNQGSAAEADPPANGLGYGTAGPSESERNKESVGVDICLSHSDLVLTDVLMRSPDVTAHLDQTAGTPEFLVISAAGERLDEFETALRTAETVTDPVVLDWTETDRVYRVAVSEKAVRVTPSLVRAGGRVLEMEGAGDQWHVHAQFRSQSALSAFRSHCSDQGITFRLDRLYWTTAEANAGVCGLTGDQRVALETAHEAGYFDVPRGISQAELAEELGISPSAVSQRIRRGMNQLIGSQLGTPEE